MSPINIYKAMIFEYCFSRNVHFTQFFRRRQRVFQIFFEFEILENGHTIVIDYNVINVFVRLQILFEITIVKSIC